MNAKTRKVAIVGGNRIPFARSNSVYSHASNQDMLTAALDGLIDRYGLQGEALGEVAGGAVLKHSHDRDLALTIGQRVAVLHQGRLIACEPPAGLRASDNPIITEFLNPRIDVRNPRFKSLET